jgi:two-component system nitrogen regulation response regulator GlnG
LFAEATTVQTRRSTELDADQKSLDLAQLIGRMLREGEADIYRKVMLAVDRAVMQAVFRYTNGNQVRASEMLGISRTTLRAKLRALRGSIKKQLWLDSDQSK